MIAIQRNVAFTVLNGGSLVAIDISTPASPVIISTLTGLSTGSLGLTVRGRYAYVVTDQATAVLNVIDIANPKSMSIVQTFTLSVNRAVCCVADGRYLFVVAETGASLNVWDIANPTSTPTLVATQGTNNGPRWIVVQGKYAYIANSVGNFQIFDISGLPGAIGSAVGSGAVAGGGLQSLAVQGKYVYVVGSGNKLSIWDVSDPTTPTQTVSFSLLTTSTYDVLVRGDVAIVSGSANAMVQFVDVTDRTVPVSLGTLSTSASLPRHLGMRGRTLYVVNNSGTMATYDLGGLEVTDVRAGDIQADFVEAICDLRSGRNLTVAGGSHLSGGFISSTDSSVYGSMRVVGALNSYRPVVSVTTTRTMTIAESGSLVSFAPASGAGYTITLPAVATSGVWYRFAKGSIANLQSVTVAGATAVLNGCIRFSEAGTGNNGVVITGKTNIIFGSTSIIGDYVQVVSNGTVWFVEGGSSVAAAITTS
jgi:hypothetical protein